MQPVLIAIFAMAAAAGQGGAVADRRAGYDHAIACAAGEALLADLLGGDAASPDDRASVADLRALAVTWRDRALALAAPGAQPGRDLAASRAGLVRALGDAGDPAGFGSRLDARLDGCAIAAAPIAT